MKLVTTYAALDLLGPAFSWSTPVYVEGAVRDGTLIGNLYIKGQGDPKLVSERLWLLLRRVQGLGVKAIAGDIVLDRSAFETLEVDPASFDGEALRPYTAAPDAVQAQWRGLAAGLAEQGDGGFAGLQDQIDRQIQDLGMAFRFGGEQEERAWPLSPFPLLIGTQEWTAIEEGLIQRARLLEHIVADIYGPQSLVHDGHLPAAVVSGSPNFSRKMPKRASLTTKRRVTIF